MNLSYFFPNNCIKCNKNVKTKEIKWVYDSISYYDNNTNSQVKEVLYFNLPICLKHYYMFYFPFNFLYTIIFIGYLIVSIYWFFFSGKIEVSAISILFIMLGSVVPGILSVLLLLFQKMIIKMLIVTKNYQNNKMVPKFRNKNYNEKFMEMNNITM